MYNFACEKLSQVEPSPKSLLHNRRFFLVPEDAVDRDRARPEYETIMGTRKLHSVSSVGIPGQFKLRELSCYCYYCVNEIDGCIKDIVDKFKVIPFSDCVSSDSNDTEASFQESTEPLVGDNLDHYNMISMIVCKDSLVAIRPDANALYDFFLQISTGHKGYNRLLL